jgi:hypothetical protein
MALPASLSSPTSFSNGLTNEDEFETRESYSFLRSCWGVDNSEDNPHTSYDISSSSNSATTASEAWVRMVLTWRTAGPGLLVRMMTTLPACLFGVIRYVLMLSWIVPPISIDFILSHSHRKTKFLWNCNLPSSDGTSSASGWTVQTHIQVLNQVKSILYHIQFSRTCIMHSRFSVSQA